MIDYIKGRVVHIETDYMILEANNIGYRIFCANPYGFQLRSEDEQTVYIHYHVREDATLLFGFQSREEQTLFRRLIDVSGIGPRIAIGILSGGRPETIIQAIQQENLALLMKLPGIGKKTAQRMVLDLKDKLDSIVVNSDPVGSADLTSTDPIESLGTVQNNWQEAKQGLISLGYTEAEVNRAWSAIRSKVKDTDSIDVIMKNALQVLYKG